MPRIPRYRNAKSELLNQTVLHSSVPLITFARQFQSSIVRNSPLNFGKPNYLLTQEEAKVLCRYASDTKMPRTY